MKKFVLFIIFASMFGCAAMPTNGKVESSITNYGVNRLNNVGFVYISIANGTEHRMRVVSLCQKGQELGPEEVMGQIVTIVLPHSRENILIRGFVNKRYGNFKVSCNIRSSRLDFDTSDNSKENR